MAPVLLDMELAIEAVSRSCYVPPEASDKVQRDLIIAEYLRSVLYNLTIGHVGEERGPVFVTRLTNAVRRQLVPVYPFLMAKKWFSEGTKECDSESIAERQVTVVLDRLKLVRDAIELKGGYWLSAPVRFVPLPQTKFVLVIGTANSAILNSVVSQSIRNAGIARMVQIEEVPRDFRSDRRMWQSFSSWMGFVPEDLATWTERLLAAARKSLIPGAAELTDFEVYAPWLNRHRPHLSRWVRAEVVVQHGGRFPSEPVLCRTPKSDRVRRRYWFGLVDGAGLRREATIDPTIVTRLTYGFDLLYGTPTQARWYGNTIVVRDHLPREEERVVHALGFDVSDTPGRLPFRFQVEPELTEVVTGILRHLGIQVVGA